MKKFLFLFAVIVAAVIFSSCATTSVQRVSTDTVTDLSGRWNDTDSQLVAEQMVKEALEFPWLNKFLKANGRNPRVIVGTISNKTDEHIDTDVFRKSIERELIKSGVVDFVASNDERSEVRNERVDQQEYSSDETAKKFKAEEAADYMLKGEVSSVVDQINGKKAVFYQVDMNLIDIQTNRIVWPGEKQIKKIIERPGLGF